MGTMKKKLRYQVQIITKRWVDPNNREAGINVNTQYDFAADEEEAKLMIKRADADANDALQVLGFYTKITMVVQRDAPND